MSFPTEFSVVQEEDEDGEAVRPAPPPHCMVGYRRRPLCVTAAAIDIWRPSSIFSIGIVELSVRLLDGIERMASDLHSLFMLTAQKYPNKLQVLQHTLLQKGTQVGFEFPAEIPTEYGNFMFRLP